MNENNAEGVPAKQQGGNYSQAQQPQVNNEAPQPTNQSPHSFNQQTEDSNGFQYAQTQPQQTVLTVQAPKNRAKTVALIAATALCVVLCFAAVSCTTLFGGMAATIGIAADSASVSTSPKIGVISLRSTIQYDGTSCSPSGLKSLLDQAKNRDDIKAIVLRVNSGGGTATAGEEMAKYVRDFEKPIVVSCAATTASAAYEIASQADYIYAAKTSSVGSIGVAMQVTDLSGLYEKLGIDIDTITSSESKDSTYGNRPLSKSEREWYQNMVNAIDEDFIQTVAEGRKMSVDDIRKLANGLTYTGVEAAVNGLVNEVGYLENAIAKASELAGYDRSLEQTMLTLSSTPDISTLLDILGQDSSNISGNSLLENSISLPEGSN